MKKQPILTAVAASFTLACAAAPMDVGGPLPGPDPEPTAPPDPDAPDAPTVPPVVTEPDDGTTPVVCDEPGALSSIIVAALKGGRDGSSVAVLGLTDNGHVVDEGVRFDVELPQAIALSPDGGEAIVTYGGNDGTRGVMVIQLGATPSAAIVAQHLTLEGAATPRDVTYTSSDSALITRIGPDDDDVVAIRRDGSDYVVSSAWAVPGEWPRHVRAVPGRDHEALLIRADVTDADAVTEIIPLTDADGAIGAGAGFEVGTSRAAFLWMHPSGERGYVPAKNPIATDEMNPSGLLHQITPTAGEGWSESADPFVVPNRGSLLAFSPGGSFGIVADSVTSEWEDPSGGISLVIREWSLDLLELDGVGVPHVATEGIVRFDATMVDDVEVSTNGLVVVSRDSGVRVPEYEDTLLVFTEYETGRWARVCEPFPLDASAELVVTAAPLR